MACSVEPGNHWGPWQPPWQPQTPLQCSWVGSPEASTEDMGSFLHWGSQQSSSQGPFRQGLLPSRRNCCFTRWDQNPHMLHTPEPQLLHMHPNLRPDYSCFACIHVSDTRANATKSKGGPQTSELLSITVPHSSRQLHGCLAWPCISDTRATTAVSQPGPQTPELLLLCKHPCSRARLHGQFMGTCAPDTMPPPPQGHLWVDLKPRGSLQPWHCQWETKRSGGPQGLWPPKTSQTSPIVLTTTVLASEDLSWQSCTETIPLGLPWNHHTPLKPAPWHPPTITVLPQTSLWFEEVTTPSNAHTSTQSYK